MTVREANTTDQSRLRAIAGSFVAGVTAMTLVGAAAAFVAHGGLDTPTANASETQFGAMPAIQPLDVAAVQGQLSQIQAEMQQTLDATDPAVSRLERLD